MRIAFIDHSYHEKTQSTQFFVRILLSIGDVEIFYDDTWNKGRNKWRDGFRESDFDLIVIWQVPEAFDALSGRHKNVVFAPMYDAMLFEGKFYWEDRFLQARCLSFSHMLHRELRIRGAKSEYFKFFPDPSEFALVTDFTDLRGYFWYRSATIKLSTILAFCRENSVGHLTVHNAPDPGQKKLSARESRSSFPELAISGWNNSYDENRAEMLRHNVYFAPRAVEGIGFSFLEAMASGMCVVAANMPTMNEYISNGTNGLLYSLEKRFPVDFSRAREMGGRARETVERGFAHWEKQRNRLIDFLAAPDRISALRSNALRVKPSVPSVNLPKVSVVTVAMNAEDLIQKTIESVLGQDYPDMEYIILDGASTDTTATIVSWYASRLAYWHSEKDNGVYHAMNSALPMCTGDFVLFMNAGDTFVDAAALSRMFAKIPSDSDVVYGHHFYVPSDGIPNYHPVADFETTWTRLQKGHVWYDWLSGVPGHQATAVRCALLINLRFDTKYLIAADHDLLFRAKLRGAKFFNSDELISTYVGGGMSAQNYDLCKKEWRSIARTYGDQAAADRFYRQMEGGPLVSFGGRLVRAIARGPFFNFTHK